MGIYAKRAKRSLSFLGVLFLLLLCMEREARAYVDPGSGAMLWQLLVGGLIGAVFSFRKTVSKLRKLGSLRRQKHDPV